jgi:hypothetical protein
MRISYSFPAVSVPADKVTPESEPENVCPLTTKLVTEAPVASPALAEKVYVPVYSASTFPYQDMERHCAPLAILPGNTEPVTFASTASPAKVVKLLSL